MQVISNLPNTRLQDADVTVDSALFVEAVIVHQIAEVVAFFPMLLTKGSGDQLINRLGKMERDRDKFFAQLKGLTLIGYYTSETGIKQELREPFMPGRYDGSVPVERG